MKIYDKSSRKRLVQQDILSNVNSLTYREHKVLTLAGPSLDEFCKTWYPKVALRYSIISFEEQEDVYKKQIKWLKGLNITNCFDKPYIEFNLGDVYDAPAQKVIDLDLMGTLESTKYIIINLFRKQKELFGFGDFIFTISLRSRSGSNIENIWSFMRMLLDTKFVSPKKEVVKGKYNIYNILPLNNDYLIKAYSYRDSSPMLTVHISF